MSDHNKDYDPKQEPLDSEEEDEDFEIEGEIEDRGLYVHTRSGKGGDYDFEDEIEEISDDRKRIAQSLFDEMKKKDIESYESERKRPKITNKFLSLMTESKSIPDAYEEFRLKLADKPEVGVSVTSQEDDQEPSKRTTHSTLSKAPPITVPTVVSSPPLPSADTMSASDLESIRESVLSAARSIIESNEAKPATKIVKFAGDYVEVAAGSSSSSSSSRNNESLDEMVKAMEEKKKISAIEKSSYDWNAFKDKEGIKEDVEKAKLDGYVESQEFLKRVDYMQFEKERDARERERMKKEAERRNSRKF